MKKHAGLFLIAFTTLAITSSFSLFAAASNPNSTPGRECSGEIAVPNMTCINPMGGADVRLYITEFQTCENNNITELDRSILGMNVVSQSSVDDIHTIDAENIDITYADHRILIDADNRVDNLSFIMPTAATIKDGDTTIEMAITNKTELDYEGASEDQFHFIGSFKIINAAGKIKKSGKLICSVNR